MLRLIYDATPAGAPNDYGDAVDNLLSAAGETLQVFPKAQTDFAGPETALAGAIDAWLARRGASRDPVIVMVHGFLFDPSQGVDAAPDSPFSSVYGLPPAVDYHTSWLPLVGECDQAGGSRAENAIAFCYKSEAGSAEFSRAGWSNNYQYAVFDQAPLAARALATILACVGNREVTVRVLAHSLGTRTFSQAVGQLRARMPPRLDRALLLDGAEFSVDAAVNFEACAFDVINFANRTDRVLQLGGQKMCHPVRINNALDSQVIGFDGLGLADRWLDLQIDKPALVSWFADGHAPDGVRYDIAASAGESSHPLAGLDHWSCYTNNGNRALVHDLLLSNIMTVSQLKTLGVPAGVDAPAYGRFHGLTPPLTPQSCDARVRLLAQADNESSGNG